MIVERVRVMTRVAVMLVACCALASCAENNQDEAAAAALLQEIQAEGFQSWERPMVFEGRQPSHTLHGVEVEVFLNDTMAEKQADIDGLCGSIAGPGQRIQVDSQGRPTDVRLDPRSESFDPDLRLEPEDYRWPEGSTIAKIAYNDDGSRRHVAAMKKVDGVWFYGEYLPDGTVEFSGRPDVCVKCHAGAPADEIFTAHLTYVCPQPEPEVP